MRLAAVVLFLVGASGCAMSEGAFNRLGKENGLRNERAYADAEAALEQRGYRLVPDEALFLSLDEDARVICKEHGGTHTEDPPLTLYVGSATRPGRPAEPPIAVTAPASTACPFYAGRRDANALVVVRDGSPARLTRIPAGATLARAPTGELVYVVSRPRVRTRRVRVDRTCNRMPTVQPGPFDIPGSALFRVRWSTGETKAPAEVPLVYDVLTIDVECTSYVY